MESLYKENDLRKKYLVSLLIFGKSVEFEVDCGAAVSLANCKWLKTNFPNLKVFETDIQLQSYCFKNLEVTGYVKVKVETDGLEESLKLYIVKGDCKPILGREWINQLPHFKNFEKCLENLCNANEINALEIFDTKVILKKYPNLVSEKFESIKGYKAHINLKPEYKPIFFRSRPVPFQLKMKVDTEIDRMVEAGILSPINASK